MAPMFHSIDFFWWKVSIAICVPPYTFLLSYPPPCKHALPPWMLVWLPGKPPTLHLPSCLHGKLVSPLILADLTPANLFGL